MDVLFSIPLFLLFFGFCIGSFLGVLIYRIPKEESIIHGRSYCQTCKKTLSWIDLVPLLSFLFLQGKCRYCRTKLSLFYPTIEFVTGLLFVYTFFSVTGNNLYSITSIDYIVSLVYYLFIISCLIVVFFIDLKHEIIPDVIIFPAVLVSFLYMVFTTSYAMVFPIILSGIGAFLLFFLLFVFTKGKGMGLGDVKFAFFMGIFLGFPNILIGLYIAFLTGAFVSIILVIVGKKKFKGGSIPFGPFLVIGTIIALFFGETLIKILGF